MQECKLNIALCLFLFPEFEKVLRWLLNEGSSVNFYMFHGGTNFGFMAGANEDLGATNEGGGEPYAADVTSYGSYLQIATLVVFTSVGLCNWW